MIYPKTTTLIDYPPPHAPEVEQQAESGQTVAFVAAVHAAAAVPVDAAAAVAAAVAAEYVIVAAVQGFVAVLACLKEAEQLEDTMTAGPGVNYTKWNKYDLII